MAHIWDGEHHSKAALSYGDACHGLRDSAVKLRRLCTDPRRQEEVRGACVVRKAVAPTPTVLFPTVSEVSDEADERGIAAFTAYNPDGGRKILCRIREVG